MIVLSAGMPKAGTAWAFNLIDGLIQAAGGAGARAVRERYGLEGLMKGRNCTIADLNLTTLERLISLGDLGESFAFKTHQAPTSAAISMLAHAKLKAVYIFRDPRDAMVSALEYGVKVRAQGRDDNLFSKIVTLNDAAYGYTSHIATVWEKWRVMPGTHLVRYEDLVADPARQLVNIGRSIGIGVDMGGAQQVVDSVQAAYGEGKTAEGVLHFNQGRTERFREVMTLAEQRFADQVFGPWLDLMGYDRTVRVVGDPPGVALHLTALTLSTRGVEGPDLRAF